MNPKAFTNRHTSHGKRYEGTAIHEYQKFMNATKTLVVVLKCGFVVSNQMPVLAATPDGKVVGFECSKPFLNHQQNLLSLQWMLVLIPNFSVNEVIIVV